MKAGAIPPNSTVTKVNGTNEYTLVHSITVYREDKSKQLIEGGLFLVSEDHPGSINCVKPETEMVWHAGGEDVVGFLYGEDAYVCCPE